MLIPHGFMTPGVPHRDSRFPGGWHECPLEECQTGVMTTNDTARPLTDQGITGGTTAVFSMKQAAQVAGISVSTLRRRRTDLIAAGADISPDGWKVPMTALVACGLIAGEGPEATSRPAAAQPQHRKNPGGSGQSRQLEELTAHVRELEHDVSEWRRRAEVAEARAEERGRALDALRVANETERIALRMLTTGTSPTIQQPPESTRSAETVTPALTPQPEAVKQPDPSTQRPSPAPEDPHRKGFFSRVMGL